MLDLFTIFSKGGIVLWCFQHVQGICQSYGPSVNELIKNVILQERGGTNTYNHGQLTLKYKLDNEFELIFVVAYQKILTLSYVDKFLDDVHRQFRDLYKDDLYVNNLYGNFDFNSCFQQMLKDAEDSSKVVTKIQMKTFEESQKSKKSIQSMIIENKKEEKDTKPKKGPKKEPVGDATNDDVVLDEETINRNRAKLFGAGKKKKEKPAPVKTVTKVKRPKQDRKWENGGTSKDQPDLDYSNISGDNNGIDHQIPVDDKVADDQKYVGTMRGALQNIDDESSGGEEEEEEEDEVAEEQGSKPKSTESRGGFGMFNMFKGLVSSKTLSREDMDPVLNKMRDHLIGKNVAADIAEKICDSVATKLEGKILGTFDRIASTVREGIQESLVQLLSPHRRIDILRDIMDCQAKNRPYVVTFCGVNGVGKSTNLAKICFWLLENNFRVMIAACDTFRSGAVEQLRTHQRRLNALHPADEGSSQQNVQLYEKGYGKDAAGIAMEAIKYARDLHFDVVLVDTAGRMQDNEPLMRSLSKLIKINQPDLVLFVGEALVGNEAVDQLTKFNQALADHSHMSNPRLIDGIVLTKFDTIDDKVGAAISMTYTTGQPIVFVGTGQTYRDLRNLNVRAVVNALLKA